MKNNADHIYIHDLINNYLPSYKLSFLTVSQVYIACYKKFPETQRKKLSCVCKCAIHGCPKSNIVCQCNFLKGPIKSVEIELIEHGIGEVYADLLFVKSNNA